MAFTKIHSALVSSTIWREPHPTRIAWVTMMVLADQHGEVFSSIPGLADDCRITVPEMEAALKCFMSPDPYSRTKDFDGRRIEEIDGGWALLNHPKYRKMASKEDSKEKAVERTTRWRKRVAAKESTPEPEPQSTGGNVHLPAMEPSSLCGQPPRKEGDPEPSF